MIIYVVQYMLYSSHVTSCHTRLHPHVISMARSGAARRGAAGCQVASEAAVQRPLLRCHPDTEEEVWRCGDFFGDFHPEKLGNCWEIQRNWGNFTVSTAWPKRSGWEQGPAGFPVGISPSKQHHALHFHGTPRRSMIQS